MYTELLYMLSPSEQTLQKRQGLFEGIRSVLLDSISPSVLVILLYTYEFKYIFVLEQQGN